MNRASIGQRLRCTVAHLALGFAYRSAGLHARRVREALFEARR
jgi:hypothetical protein